MKKLKVLSFVPESIMTEQHFKEAFPIGELIYNYIKYEKGLKTQLTPVLKENNVVMYEYSKYIVYFDKKENIVGGLTYYLIKDIPIVKYVFIKPKFRNLGLGLNLYNVLLKKYGKFLSDHTLTPSSFKLYSKAYSKNKCKAFYLKNNTLVPVEIISLDFNNQEYRLDNKIFNITKKKFTINGEKVFFSNKKYSPENFRLMVIK